MIEYEDFEKICRTCLEEITNSISLFSVCYINEEKLTISEILTACTSIEVSENDNLPKQVCIQCENNILNAFSFQQQCYKSHLVLGAILTELTQSRRKELKPLENNEVTLLNSIEFNSILSNGTFEQKEDKNLEGDPKLVCGGKLNEDSYFVVNIDNASGSVNTHFNEQKQDKNLKEQGVCESIEENLGNDLVPHDRAEEEVKLRELQQDIEDDTSEKFICKKKECFACFATIEELKEHSKEHLPKYHDCKICNKSFYSARILYQHMTLKHQPEKKTQRFVRSDLKKHIQSTGERPFKTHNNVKKWHECSKCDRRLYGLHSLAMHMKIHTDGKKDFICNVCNKWFSSTRTLIVHKRLHTGERPYSCNTCGKSFTESSKLTIHCRIHSGERPHVCTHCGRGCISSSRLKTHLRIHTEEKPYQCNLCTQSFTQRANLTSHTVNVHLGERKYVCDICNHKFARKSTMMAHKWIHTGERKHVCDICQKGFVHKHTLTTHMKVHTGEKPYKCKICNKCFTKCGSYWTHMRSHNPEDKYVHSKIEDEKKTILQGV